VRRDDGVEPLRQLRAAARQGRHAARADDKLSVAFGVQRLAQHADRFGTRGSQEAAGVDDDHIGGLSLLRLRQAALD
jgi:hypothetical protein